MKKNVNNSTVNGASAASSAQSTNSYMQYTQYRNRQAHGWAAEDANAMADRLAGKAVDQVGRNNSCNGADRIVNGVQIQTKYCATAQDSVNAAFQDCRYRYSGMKLEEDTSCHMRAYLWHVVFVDLCQQCTRRQNA